MIYVDPQHVFLAMSTNVLYARRMESIRKLKEFYTGNKRMPSYSELALLLGFKSKWGAQRTVSKWLTQGVIYRDARGKLLPGKSLFSVKVMGTVAAGWPSPAEEEMADAISLDEWLIANKEATFMLKVSGDSMKDAGIMPGDMVLLERGKLPKHKDIVVAEIDREWTIKYFYKKGNRTALVPANKKYKPIFPKEELRIAGVVTAVIRKYSI